MTVSLSVSALTRWTAFNDLTAALAQGAPCLEAAACWGGGRALVLAGLVETTGRPLLAVVPSPAERHALALDLAFFLRALGGDPHRVLEFPSAEPAHWSGGRQREADAERAQVCR